MANGSVRGKGNFYFNIGSDTLTLTKGDISVNIDKDEIDTTTDSEVGYKCFIEGDYSASVSGSFNYGDIASTPAAQDAVRDAAINKTTLSLEWAYETGATKPNYTATGFVTNYNNTNADPMTVSFTIRIDGQIEEGVQA